MPIQRFLTLVLHRQLRERYPSLGAWETRIGRWIVIVFVVAFLVGLIVNNHWLSL